MEACHAMEKLAPVEFVLERVMDGVPGVGGGMVSVLEEGGVVALAVPE
jgi:hypothetical protein